MHTTKFALLLSCISIFSRVLFANSYNPFGVSSIADGVQVYYLWANDEHKNRLLGNNGSCMTNWMAIIEHNKKDNTFGKGIYAAANLYDSMEYGEHLIEVIVDTRNGGHLSPYMKPDNHGTSNITWYHAAQPNGISFRSFTGEGMSNEDLWKQVFNSNSRDDVNKIQRYTDWVFFNRHHQDHLNFLKHHNHPILFSHGAIKRQSFGLKYSISGAAIVQNKGHHKEILLVYTTDDWQTYSHIPLSYTGTEYDGGKELWSYKGSISIRNKTQFKSYLLYKNPETGDEWKDDAMGSGLTIERFFQL